MTNPTSGAHLYVSVFYPPDWNGTDLLPALVLMPGGTGRSDAGSAVRLVGRGFLVVVFDPDGRGKSQGWEDYNGFITQDGWRRSLPLPWSCPVWIQIASARFPIPTA